MSRVSARFVLATILACVPFGCGGNGGGSEADQVPGSGGLASGGVFGSGASIMGSGATASGSGGVLASGGAATGGLFSSGGISSTGGSASGGTATGGGSAIPVAGDGRQVFLLFGQSNMEGVPTPQAADKVQNPNIEVLGYDASCNNRKWNEWSVALAPLHRCWTGVGPGDGFSKRLAEAWPEAKIALVPAAISGVDIDFFRKGVTSSRRSEFQIPPDNKATGAYSMLLERAKLAQKTGTIRGILFHQGESDKDSPLWISKVKEIVEDLRTDLALGEDVPFIAGELYYSGCCASHTTLVNQLPNSIPNAHVVSASGLAGQDQYHFDLAGQRTLGTRYAEKFLEAIGQ